MAGIPIVILDYGLQCVCFRASLKIPVKIFSSILKEKLYHQLNKCRDYFYHNIKIQSSHYRNKSTDPLGTGRESLGISAADFGNHCNTVFNPTIKFGKEPREK